MFKIKINQNLPTTSVNLNSDTEVKIVESKTSKKTRKTTDNAQTSVELTNRGNNEGDDENLDEIQEELVLKYGAQHVVKLFIPVTICLFFVIISLSAIKSYQKSDGAQL